MNNLVGLDEYAFIQSDLDKQLNLLLEQTGDDFLPGDEYMKMWGYNWDRNDNIRVRP